MAVVVVLVAHVCLLAYSASIHSPVWDEVGHLPAGIAHWKSGVFDLYRVNPPLIRLWATVIPFLRDMRPPETEERFYSSPDGRAEFPSGSAWIHAAPESFLQSLWIARWTCIPLSVIGALACYQLAYAMFGRSSAFAALILWCFSPMILGHGSLITPDVGSASLAAIAVLGTWRWLEQSTWLSATAAGAALGLACLAKFTNLFLVPSIFAAAWLGRSRQSGGIHASLARRSLQLAWLGVVAVDLINAVYLFEGTGTTLGEFQFVSRTFRGPANVNRPFGNRFVEGWASRLPVPLPANYLQGIDVQRRDFEGRLLSYLRGEWRHEGWYYYYIYAFLVKEPVGTLLLLAASVCCIASPFTSLRKEILLYAVLPAMTFLVALSLQTGFNHHLRYLLPAYPFLYVIASAPFADSPGSRQRRFLRYAAALCVATSVAGSLLVYPHSLSFFNSLAGGPAAGPRHLHNSNVDWGQDLLLLSDWADRNPDCRPLRIVFSSGYHSEDLPFWGSRVIHGELTDREWRSLLAGPAEPIWYAISAGRLYDHPLTDPKYRYFRERQPTVVIGYSIYVYRLTGERY